MADQTDHHISREIVQWVMSVLVSAMMGLIYIVYTGLSADNDDQAARTAGMLLRLDKTIVQMATYQANVDAHIEESNYWKREIEGMRKDIANLRTHAAARADPFTGTEGRALERRIDTLERRFDEHEHKLTR